MSPGLCRASSLAWGAVRRLATKRIGVAPNIHQGQLEMKSSASELIYGYHPVREMLRHRPQRVVRVLVSTTRRADRRRSEIEQLVRKRGVQLESAAEHELRTLVGSDHHNGFVAEVKAAPDGESPSADSGLRVLVEDIQDPHNLGAMIRVCEGAGVGEMLVRDRGSAPLGSTVAKVSAGAVEWLPVERITNSSRTIRELQEKGFWVYGADAGGVPPWEIDLTGNLVLCFGGEQKGLREQTKRSCDGLIGLPMRGRVESLNVSTALSAILYEAVRQRLAEVGEKS